VSILNTRISERGDDDSVHVRSNKAVARESVALLASIAALAYYLGVDCCI
jgi:hypothetical protein